MTGNDRAPHRADVATSQPEGNGVSAALDPYVQSPSDNPIRRRALIVAVIVAPILYAFIVNFAALDNPPAWDSAVTVSPAALTIVELDFDIWEVAQLPGTLEGGPSTHATSIYTIGLALLISLFGPSTAFLIAHISSVLMAGALAGVTFLLARERLSPAGSALVALSVAALPIVLQQTADVYLDLPLAIITTLTCWTATRRMFWVTAGLVVVGVALKTSAVFLLPLLLVARPLNKSTRSHLLQAVIAGSVALIPFLIALSTTDRFDSNPAFADQLTLIQSATSLLVLTVDVLVIFIAYVLVVYGRARRNSLDRVTKISLVLVAAFALVHLATVLLTATITILPRYYIDILPVVIVTIPSRGLLTGSARDSKKTAALVFLSVLIVFSLANRNGEYYPFADHDFYIVAERSTRAQDLLALQLEGTSRLVSQGLPVVVGHQEHFRLNYPDMGYVAETPEEVISIITDIPSRLPERFAMLIEPRVDNVLVELEAMLLDMGYQISYEQLSVGGYESRVAVVTAPTTN